MEFVEIEGVCSVKKLPSTGNLWMIFLQKRYDPQPLQDIPASPKLNGNCRENIKVVCVDVIKDLLVPSTDF